MRFYDILTGMRRMYLFCLVGTLALAGCTTTYEYDEYDEYLQSLGCNAGNPNCVARQVVQYPAPDTTNPRYVFVEDKPVKEIKYSSPAGNDLRLETDEYIIQVQGAPNKKYDYYVWAGDKQYTDDPDLIIQDGNAAVLISE